MYQLHEWTGLQQPNRVTGLYRKQRMHLHVLAHCDQIGQAFDAFIDTVHLQVRTRAFQVRKPLDMVPAPWSTADARS